MVRFIIDRHSKNEARNTNLHSNMVRFIICASTILPTSDDEFTFQYGQIYYRKKRTIIQKIYKIYIPIWLDLLYYKEQKKAREENNLHSNMVRFIISKSSSFSMYLFSFTFQYGQIYYSCCCSACCVRCQIYIPIWLDLLFSREAERRGSP